MNQKDKEDEWAREKNDLLSRIHVAEETLKERDR